MGTAQSRQVEHEINVRAPAAAVYGLIAEVGNWPRIFPPTIYVDYLERGARDERIQIWATANGTVKTWVSRRQLDPDALRIEFRQEVSAPPVARMGGTWVIEPLSDSASRVRLLHDYRAVDDDPAGLDWIDQAVDTNSRSELAALKINVESAHNNSELLLSFEDTVRIDAPARDVYDFLDQAQLWTERVPHVAAVTLTEDVPGLQVLEMDTRTKDGATHTTKSVRVCFPHSRIVYKQTVVPALMTLHTGYWLLAEDGAGTTATAQHTVLINPARITEILGAGAGLDQARDYLRTALSGNSRATLGYAKDYAESHVEQPAQP
jgi:aromatase